MDLTQTRTIPAPRDRVWAGLVDPDVLKSCIPGCEAFERTGDHEYRTTVAAKVGPVSARFSGRVQLADVVPPERYTLSFEGQGGAAGFANGSAAVSVADAPDGGTLLSYTVKAQVGGKLAQIGNRLVDGAARKLADDFFARFAQRMAPAAAVAETAETGALVAGAAQAGTGAAMPAAQAGQEAAPQIRWTRWIAIAAMIAIVVWLYWQGTGHAPR